MTWRSRSTPSAFQIRVNWGSPTLTETPRITSPPSPNRASPKPSPSPAPGLSFGSPPPALGLVLGRNRRSGSSGTRSSWVIDGEAGSIVSRGAIGMGRGVLRPPVKASAPRTPFGEPASRESNAIGPLSRGAKYQQPRISKRMAWSVTEQAHPLSDSGVHHGQGSAGASTAAAAAGATASRPGGPAIVTGEPAGA